jgi:AcrR family transcriptional regulator
MPSSPVKSRDPEVLLTTTVEPDFRQERSRRSYQALIDAATELFGTHAYDAVGTPEIAQRAGVSVGTYYRYFTDKHEIYLEIARRTMASAHKATIDDLGPERFVGRARHETIAATVDALFEHVMTRPLLSRSIIEMSLRDPKVAELRRAFESLAVQRLARLISAIAPSSVIGDPYATAYVLHACALECAHGVAGSIGPIPIDAARIKSALTKLIERVLFPTPSAP